MIKKQEKIKNDIIDVRNKISFLKCEIKELEKLEKELNNLLYEQEEQKDKDLSDECCKFFVFKTEKNSPHLVKNEFFNLDDAYDYFDKAIGWDNTKGVALSIINNDGVIIYSDGWSYI